MATSDLAPPRGVLNSAGSRQHVSAAEFSLMRVLSFLASLRVTVTLFALSIFLIFVGTLAQKDQDVWRVVNDTYFRVWIARVDIQVFERLVQLFRKTVEWNLHGTIPFFGGKTLGLALLINLTAAHAIRFKVAAEGKRLYIGLATIVAGVLATYLVIRGGMNQSVESELSPAFCDILWQCFRGLLAALVIAGAYVLTFWNAPAKHKLIEWWLVLVVNVLLAILTVWLLAHPEMRLDNSGIRILWQLAKATASGIILLVGCVMVFRRRAGIVLLHGGIALIMLAELFTAVAAVESQMNIADGATANFTSDMRTSELSIIDRSPADSDRVTVVPKKLLLANVGSNAKIDLPDLPFTIQVRQWMENSLTRAANPAEKNSATDGLGKARIAESLPAATGVGESAEQQDFPSAYVELFSKKTGKSIGTFLLSQRFEDEHHRVVDQPVEVDGHTYDLALRYQRIYHPFTITLKDFSMSHYVGTSTAKNYKSLVVFKDPEHNVEREVPIWMNNPLRYSGTTFYQQSFHVNENTGKATGTVLQVVTNPSWMTPYVGCMLVMIGMFAHFGTMLFRFLERRAEDVNQLDATNWVAADKLVAINRKDSRRERDTKAVAPGRTWTSFVSRWFAAVVVLVFAGYIISKARMPESKPNAMKIYEFAELPLVYEGRVKPFDTLARNTLQVLSERQEVGVLGDDGKVASTQPAIRWLLDTISGAKGAQDARVFRIENLDLLDSLGLERRPQFWRYSLNEIRNKKTDVVAESPSGTEIQRQVILAQNVPENERSLFQNKVLELGRKLSIYSTILEAFAPPPLKMDGNEDDVKKSWQEAQLRVAQLNASQVPRVVPPADASAEWTTLMQAELDFFRNTILKQPTNPAAVKLSSLLTAYAQENVADFNKGLAEYRAILTNYENTLAAQAKELRASGVAQSEILSQPKTEFEVFFNQFSPFYYACVLYVVAFLLGIGSWLGWTKPLRQASIWLLWFTFGLHTFALVARVYISGRPPITNLYSTAIVIGWAVVLLALVFESIQKLGLANILAAVIGFITLFLAHNLSLDGDTFIVLQAVLDTQFWLATHVITINLGYAATYLTGAWGITYILCAHVFPILDQNDRKLVLRALYGTLCFAIFFSFVGTVLGGLWADDSWGRFWGWDPKENGALMIVLWNALVLHARWGALVKGRGLAVLAVVGNIITTWSYFGVNEYGIGLHAYGKTESNTPLWLLVFAGTQLAIIALGLMPQRWFPGERGPSVTGSVPRSL